MGLDYIIQYRRGKENVVADASSRRNETAACQAITTVVPEWMGELEASYDQSEWLQGILTQLAIQPTAIAYYTLSNGLIRYKGRLVVGDDSALKERIVGALHASPVGGHSGIKATYQKVKQLFFLA